MNDKKGVAIPISVHAMEGNGMLKKKKHMYYYEYSQTFTITIGKMRRLLCNPVYKKIVKYHQNSVFV